MEELIFYVIELERGYFFNSFGGKTLSECEKFLSYEKAKDVFDTYELDDNGHYIKDIYLFARIKKVTLTIENVKNSGDTLNPILTDIDNMSLKDIEELESSSKEMENDYNKLVGLINDDN